MLRRRTSDTGGMEVGVNGCPTVPSRFVVARAEQKKPGVLVSILGEIYPPTASEATSRTMIFCGSVEHAHRLARLLQIYVVGNENIKEGIKVRGYGVDEMW